MSEKRCAELDRDILNYSKALRYLKGIYLESFNEDQPEPSLKQIVDTGAYLKGRIFKMESNLQMLKKVESVTE